MRAVSWIYLAISGPIAAFIPLTGQPLRSWLNVLLSVATLIAITSYLPRVRGLDRLPWALLAAAVGWLVIANVVQAAAVAIPGLVAIFPISYLLMLAAAITLVLRRGRDDVGGLIDASIAAVGLGGLLWMTLLAPRLDTLDAGTDERFTLMITVLVLAAVLGALVRLIVVSKWLPSLIMLAVSICCVLAANVAEGMLTGTTYGAVPGWIDLLFAGPYLFCGLLPLHRSADQLVVPGPAPEDRLTVARLVFLGAAFCLNPVAAGIRSMAGHDPDGLVLVLDVLLTAPLVLLRIGRVARERGRSEDALRRQATHDLLTGLPNRAELHHRLDDALRRDQDVVLLFGDLDGFKAVNDRFGHLAGDELLVQVAARIRAALTAGDMVFRYGGDEFLILCGDPDTARRVQETVRESFTLTAGVVRVGISIGAATADGRLGADELIRHADQAMYRAKESGRARRGLRVA
ncbi:diguanylate cyclase domain-containing protein [Micromonosporaceae bacterium Da 78-11]